MKLRRSFFILAAMPLALYVYACSSGDDAETPGVDGGGADTGTYDEDGSTPGTDSGKDDDAGGETDAGTDSGPEVPTCVGNPLTADGGTVDGGVSVDGGVRQIYDEPVLGSSFIDGPQWDDFDGGSLFFSQLYANPPEVRVTGPDGGAATTFRASANNRFPIGNAYAPDGGVLTVIAAASNAGIWRTSLDGGPGTSVPVAPSTNPNDLVVGPKGNVYFTDPQYQTNPAGNNRGVYRVAPDGTVSLIEQIDDRPNGVALSPDQKKLYVTVSDNVPTPDSPRVRSYDVAADGSVDKATGKDLTLTLAQIPDGMAVDIGGNLWIAESATAGSSGVVEVFTPAGVKLGQIPFPNSRPTSVAFGGKDNKSVYITTEDGIFVYQSRCAGLR